MLRAALAKLDAGPTHVWRASSFHKTAPVGGPPQGDFLNAVCAIDTELAPAALLEHLQALERDAGRQRDVRFGPRTLDLDLLVYRDVVIRTEELTLPHPRMLGRAFVMQPLKEICTPDQINAIEQLAWQAQSERTEIGREPTIDH
jgi:2-amino-4-hydroxy-6-hydroxymethyldihydropteridine diphosphokinase